MATSLIRYALPDQAAPAHWGVLFDRHIAPLSGTYPTTSALIEHGQVEARAMTAAQAALPLDNVKVLSPITTNQQFLCQGINYGSHVRESGMDPANIPFNTFFTKASSSLTGPLRRCGLPAPRPAAGL
jgi:2,4-diketo-3-deoxy-L-fuconate hydrolase